MGFSLRSKGWQLWYLGMAAPWYVGSSRIRDRTHVSGISRRVLYD